MILIQRTNATPNCYIVPPLAGIRPEFNVELRHTAGQGLTFPSGDIAGQVDCGRAGEAAKSHE